MWNANDLIQDLNLGVTISISYDNSRYSTLYIYQYNCMYICLSLYVYMDVSDNTSVLYM